MFLASLLFLFLAGAGYLALFASRRRNLLRRDWDDVLAELRPVHLDALRLIAQVYLQPEKDQLRIEPQEMWELLGGLKGIRRLKANARVMLNLAVFAQRWNREQGPIVAEMIRREAVRLDRAVFRLELIFLLHLGLMRVPFHLLEAASSYYLIRGRLIGLYQVSHIGLMPRLEAAL